MAWRTRARSSGIARQVCARESVGPRRQVVAVETEGVSRETSRTDGRSLLRGTYGVGASRSPGVGVPHDCVFAGRPELGARTCQRRRVGAWLRGLHGPVPDAPRDNRHRRPRCFT